MYAVSFSTILMYSSLMLKLSDLNYQTKLSEDIKQLVLEGYKGEIVLTPR